MPTIFKNAKIFDGSGSRRFSGSVAVEDDRILEVASQSDSRPDDAVIDCAGTLSKSAEISLNEHVQSAGLPGPRLIPSSVEREHPNETELDPGKVVMHGRGPDGIREFVRECAEIGAKAVKFPISGESVIEPGASHELLYTEEELMAAGEQALDVSILQNKDHLAVIMQGG